ncbi:MAG TPA: acetate--CoA ligase [Acidimicrobiales bacterium]|nr:acetate--CoA ligase [Acidimicrobiales bacterium]
MGRALSLSVVQWETIRKFPHPSGVTPNMAEYERERRSFSWDGAHQWLDGLPGGAGLNIAYEAVDRHAAGAISSKPALRWLRRGGDALDITYGELSERSSRFANALESLGLGAGERVFLLSPRSPDVFVAVLGTLKRRAVLCPVFAAFGPEPVRQRMELGSARVLVTTYDLYRRKVAKIRDRLPLLEHVLLSGDLSGRDLPAGTTALDTLLDAQPSGYRIAPTHPEEMALLHFTSGTTGTPKGAVHVHEAVVAHHATGLLALDLHPDDVFWCTADPGWVTGTSYGIISPLTCGVTSVVEDGEFEAERWYGILETMGVTVWYTSPTALRMLMQAGPEPARAHDLSRLRFIASVGEPLNPEVVVWARDTLGLPVHDNWWQTETGGIMIANYACMDIRPGSMGRPLPGVEAGVLLRDEHDRVVIGPDGAAREAGPGQDGELALRPGWPSMFRGYLGDEERYRAAFDGGWYLTGDLARRDGDGYFWFLGRGDDVIKSAGHLIGPFEVESTLLEHPSVAEAAVIGKPDPVAGEVVKAYVTLARGYAPDDELRLELLGFARSRLGATVAPREIEFDQHLPHTHSGKIVRRLLKERELHHPGLGSSGPGRGAHR